MKKPGSTAFEPDPREAARIRRSSFVVLACFVFVCVYFVGIYPGASDANQKSHYQLLRALAERGEASIEPEIRDLGAHSDIAAHAGRRYSDKAPGLSTLAIPGYRVMRLFLPAPSSLDDWLVFYGARVLSVTLVATLALVVFVRKAERLVPAPRQLPLWLFALLFATPFLVYSRSFFAHALVAGLLFLSFAGLWTGKGLPSAFGSGLAAGVAVASEYPAVAIAICLLVLALTAKNLGRLTAFIFGAGIPAAALAVYHARHFGSVFAFPAAASEAYEILAHRGVSGVSWPSASAVLGLFVDPSHGLLYFSPFLILWPVVALGALRDIPRNRSLVVTAVGPLLLLLLISGFLPPHWRGGWCLGPRYLVAGFLLVFWLLLSRAPERRGPVALGLLLAGIAYGAVILAVSGSTYWLIPYDAWNPARTVSLSLLQRGLVEFNLGVAAGLPPLVSLAPPLLACAVAFVAAVRGARIARFPLLAGTLAGLLAAAAVLAIPPSSGAVEHSFRRQLGNALLPSMRAGWR